VTITIDRSILLASILLSISCESAEMVSLRAEVDGQFVNASGNGFTE
jgi:hypothetical protein